MSTLEKAVILAARAHAGQTDKAGAPYLLHPLRVMLAVDHPVARIAAVLHDVIEDSDTTLADLRRMGFSREVVSAVDAVTHRAEESYEAFVLRAATDPLGKLVKRADLLDNLDLSRIPHPSEADRTRAEKYRRALALLDSAQDPPVSPD